MNEKLTTSVVMATYNGEKYIKEDLEKRQQAPVLKQSEAIIEVTGIF